MPPEVPGSESTLIDGGSFAATVGSGVSGGGGVAFFAVSVGFASALDAAVPGPRPFHPRPTPAASATTPRATAPTAIHAVLRGRGADTVIDAYDVFGVCHDGPVGPEAGYGGIDPGGTLPDIESGGPGGTLPELLPEPPEGAATSIERGVKP